jgi:hypothetical protein
MQDTDSQAEDALIDSFYVGRDILVGVQLWIEKNEVALA